MLNQLRREAVEKLRALQAEQPQRLRAGSAQAPGFAALAQRTRLKEEADSEIHILARTPQQLDAAIALRPSSITLDYLDLYGLRPSIERVKAAGIPARVASPRILKPGESRILNFLLSLDCAILVRSAGMLHALRDRHIDRSSAISA